MTYKVDNPNKFPFEKPIFSKIESTPEINLIKTINEINIFYEKKKKKQNGEVKVEFQIVLDPDIKWDHPEYELVLLDCNYYKFKGLTVYLQEGIYQRCICRVSLKGKVIMESKPIILDLTKDTNKII